MVQDSSAWPGVGCSTCPLAKQSGSRLQLSCTLVQVLIRAEGNAASGGDYQAQPAASLSQAAACTRWPQGKKSLTLCRWPCLSGYAMSQQNTPWLWPYSSRPSCSFSHKVHTICISHAPCLSASLYSSRAPSFCRHRPVAEHPLCHW